MFDGIESAERVIWLRNHQSLHCAVKEYMSTDNRHARFQALRFRSISIATTPLVASLAWPLAASP